MRSNRILPYPEGTACAEVLLAAEDGAGEGGSRGIFAGMGISALAKLLTDGLGIVPGTVAAKIGALRTEFSRRPIRRWSAWWPQGAATGAVAWTAGPPAVLPVPTGIPARRGCPAGRKGTCGGAAEAQGEIAEVGHGGREGQGGDGTVRRPEGEIRNGFGAFGDGIGTGLPWREAADGFHVFGEEDTVPDRVICGIG